MSISTVHNPRYNPLPVLTLAVLVFLDQSALLANHQQFDGAGHTPQIVDFPMPDPNPPGGSSSGSDCQGYPSPFSVSTGNLRLSAVDIQVRSFGPDMCVIRTYRSLDQRSGP